MTDAEIVMFDQDGNVLARADSLRPDYIGIHVDDGEVIRYKVFGGFIEREWSGWFNLPYMPPAWERYRGFVSSAFGYAGESYLIIKTTKGLIKDTVLPSSRKGVPEHVDKATAALVYSSIPQYRNSDRCPKPNCGRTGVFVQMALCCPTHGAFHG